MLEKKRLNNPAFANSLTYVVALRDSEDDNPTNHSYVVHRMTDGEAIGAFNFQCGAISEKGVEGVTNEDLLAMLIDRVESFQNSKMKCRENEQALCRLYEALFWLNQRQNKRKK